MQDDVADRDQAGPGRAGQRGPPGETRIIPPIIAGGEAGKDVLPESGLQLRERRGCVMGRIVHDDEDAVVPPLQDIFQDKVTLSLPGAALSKGEHPAEMAIAGPAFRIGQDIRRIGEAEAHTDNVAHTEFLRCSMAPHDPGKRIPVDNGDGRKIQFPGTRDQLPGMRCSREKCEIAHGAQLGIAHGNCPATYQAGSARPGQVTSQRRGPLRVSTRQ